MWCEFNCVCIKIPLILQKEANLRGMKSQVVGFPSKNAKSSKPKPLAKLHTAIKENSRFIWLCDLKTSMDSIYIVMLQWFLEKIIVLVTGNKGSNKMKFRSALRK